MIEFTGYLSGKTLKVFKKRFAGLYQISLLCGVVVVTPFVIAMSMQMHWKEALFFIPLGVVSAVFLPYLQVKTDKMQMVPKRIYIKDGKITAICDKLDERKSLEDVTKVYDCGEFYKLKFGVIEYPLNFLCQKDHLTKGTIEEFEALFEGKIIRNCKPR